jgi:hypothetical protein
MPTPLSITRSESSLGLIDELKANSCRNGLSAGSHPEFGAGIAHIMVNGPVRNPKVVRDRRRALPCREKL